MNTFTVDNRDRAARTLAAVLECVGKDDTLPMLTHVRFERDDSGRVIVAATDRYVLGAFDLATHEDGREGGAFDALVPSADVKRIIALIKSEKLGYVTFSFDGDTLTVANLGGSSLIVKLGEDWLKFPAWRGLLPTNEELTKEADNAGAFGFNPVNMAKLAKCIERKGEGVRMVMRGPRKPVVALTDLGVVLIMPVNFHVEGKDMWRLPEWLSAPVAEVAAA